MVFASILLFQDEAWHSPFYDDKFLNQKVNNLCTRYQNEDKSGEIAIKSSSEKHFIYTQ